MESYGQINKENESQILVAVGLDVECTGTMYVTFSPTEENSALVVHKTAKGGDR